MALATLHHDGDRVPDGEALLWGAVVERAIADVALGLDILRRNPGVSRGIPLQGVYHGRAAARWFLGGGRDFREVCAAAGLDPSWVRRKAIEGVGEGTLRALAEWSPGAEVPLPPHPIGLDRGGAPTHGRSRPPPHTASASATV